MAVVGLYPTLTGSNGPVQREGSHAIHSGGDAPVEVLFTRVVPAPGGVIRGVVES